MLKNAGCQPQVTVSLLAIVGQGQCRRRQGPNLNSRCDRVLPIKNPADVWQLGAAGRPRHLVAWTWAASQAGVLPKMNLQPKFIRRVSRISEQHDDSHTSQS